MATARAETVGQGHSNPLRIRLRPWKKPLLQAKLPAKRSIFELMSWAKFMKLRTHWPFLQIGELCRGLRVRSEAHGEAH